MLPVVKGSVFTAKAIYQYGWATILLSWLGIIALPAGGFLYGVLLVPFNVRLFQMVQRLAMDPEDLNRAKGLFRWSILYMFGICLLLVISRVSLADQFHHQAIYILSNMTNLVIKG